TGKEAIVVGKPSKDFFKLGLNALGSKSEETIMIGDDIFSDIGGAASCSLRTILVRTGKFNEDVLKNSKIKPDFIINSIADLKKLIFN
ncbi:MAG: HAD hydrolase-like protein, partial [Candidatus Helarchaeota archaeon]